MTENFESGRLSIAIDELGELLAGRRPELEVGHVPLEVKRHFGSSRDTVYLSHESAGHIIKKHGADVTTSNLLLLPMMLQRGLWINDRALACVISFEDHNDTRRLKAALKVTNDRRRYYITTLHRTAPKQTKSLIRRGQILRQHWI